jgi:hypothetical protein
MILILERVNRIVARRAVGFALYVAAAYLSSWVSLNCVSYKLATVHNRVNLEFLVVDSTVLVEIMISGAVFYGIFIGCASLFVTSLDRSR